MSRRVFNAILSEDNINSDVASIAFDVTRLMKQDVVSLSHSALNKYLLNNNSSDMIDLLRRYRIFTIKRSTLRLTHL